MSAMASQVTGDSLVCSIVCFGIEQRKHQSSALQAPCEGNPPVTGGFPSQRASNAENVSIWWRHHVHHCWGHRGCILTFYSNHLQSFFFQITYKHIYHLYISVPLFTWSTFLQNTHNRHTSSQSVNYQVSFGSSKHDLCLTFVITTICVIWWYNWSRYNEMRMYYAYTCLETSGPSQYEYVVLPIWESPC